MKSFIKIIDPGYYTSIQDLGRYGYREMGFPVSGPMDYNSFTNANKLVGNSSNEAVLESTLKGPKILFSSSCIVAVTGADVSIYKNGNPVELNKSFHCELGDILEIGVVKKGFRNYIGFGGGIFPEKVFGSYSQYHPITIDSNIKKGQNFLINTINRSLEHKKIKIKKLDFNQTIEVYKGPFWDKIENSLKNKILNSEFKIGSNNRMAYVLSGIDLKNKISLLSTSVMPGTVQLTPKGDLLVVMRDGQVTGGYPRILQVTEDSQSKISQFATGKLIRFKLVNMVCLT